MKVDINPYIEEANKILSNNQNKPGIYSINIQGKKVYIGKSRNLSNRLAQHMQNIYTSTEAGLTHKYQILKKASRAGMAIEFSILYFSTKTEQTEIDDDIGSAEAVFIDYYHPALNIQLPRVDNYRKYFTSEKAKKIKLEEIFEE